MKVRGGDDMRRPCVDRMPVPQHVIEESGGGRCNIEWRRPDEEKRRAAGLEGPVQPFMTSELMRYSLRSTDLHRMCSLVSF